MFADYPLMIKIAVAVLCAALAQIFFKAGATETDGLRALINIPIGVGLLLYGAGTLLWLRALSDAPLAKVYPFSVLTLLLVQVGAVAVFGEKLTVNYFIGAALIVAGLLVVGR